MNTSSTGLLTVLLGIAYQKCNFYFECFHTPPLFFFFFTADTLGQVLFQSKAGRNGALMGQASLMLK